VQTIFMFFTEVEKLGIRSQGKRIGSETIKFIVHTTLLSGKQ
jgi:hypothetical protein